MSQFRKKFKRPRFRNRPSGEKHRELLADPQAVRTTISVFAYSPTDFREKSKANVEELVRLTQEFPVVWIDVCGLADVHVVKAIGEQFSIHPLVLEDIVRTHQRPKAEDYPDAIFIVTRMAPLHDQEDTEQLSLYVTPRCVITFQEYPGDVFDGVRNRIRQSRGRIRHNGPDYLAYAILDAAIDAYFPIVDQYGERVETLEDAMIIHADRSVLTHIYQVRRKILELRRALWPQREMLASLYRSESPLITAETQVFFRDCYDHTIQLIDLMENYRELSSNLMEVYLSSVSNRLNEIMKVLTIISVIFIPLTFVVGVYGMNFRPEASPWNMPELVSYYGYPLCMLGMLIVAVVMLVVFWRKGWLGTDERAHGLGLAGASPADANIAISSNDKKATTAGSSAVTAAKRKK